MSTASPAEPDAGRADLSNWRLPPFNHWAFHHIREILPVADIAHPPGDVMPLPAGDASLDGFSLPWANGARLSLWEALDATVTDAMLVLKDGRVVFETYAHGMDAATPHIWMSATKSLVGLVAGRRQYAGAIDRAAPVTRYLPELAGTAYDGATLRQLVDMRTGIALAEAAQADYASAGGWDPPQPGAPSGLHAFFRGLKGAHRPHGGSFSYVSGNTDLLAWTMERASGESFAALAGRLLWRPMGAELPAFITLDPDGAPRCTGGYCATVRDFARLGQLVVDGGQRDRVQVIPMALIEDIATGGDPEAWATGEWGQVFGFTGGPMRYRTGWNVVDSDPQLLFAMGIHGQNLFVDRTNRIVVAKLSSQASRIDYTAVPMTHRMVAEIQRLLS
jgi:CubicO group peptidase (beta-lactamase class C family)